MRFLRLFVRKFKNNLRYFIIMAIGSGLALSATLFIVSYISNELSFNKYTGQSDNLYRIVSSNNEEGYERSETPGPLYRLLVDKSPFVSDGFRYLNEPYEFQINEQVISEISILSDASISSLLEFSFINGTIDKFEDTPNGVIISQSFAEKYFKSENPVGMNLSGSPPFEQKEDLIIVGVIKDIPKNSTIKGDIIINMAFVDKKAKYNPWVYSYENYILIPENKNLQVVENSISEILKAEFEKAEMKGFGDGISYRLQQFDNIYLQSSEIKDRTIKGNYKLIKILIGIGVLIIGLFVFNYIIISSGILIKNSGTFVTMRSFGMSNKNLRNQLIGESVLSMIVSIILSGLIYILINNVLSEFLGISTNFNFRNKYLFGFLFSLLLIATISGISINQFVKKLLLGKEQFARLPIRSLLTTTQLSIFILLSISMLIISKQVSFLKNTDLGYDLENTVIVSAMNKKQREILYNNFSNKSYVKSIAFGQGIYGQQPALTTFSTGKRDVEVNSIVRLADHNYLKTFNIRLVEGRNIKYTEIINGNEKQRSKIITEVLVNKEFVKKAGLQKPIGTIIKDKDGMMVGEIVGIIENVHQSAFYEPVEPIVLGNMPYHRASVILNLVEGAYDKFMHDFKECAKSVSMELYVDLLHKVNNKDQVFAKEIVLFRLLVVSFAVAMIIMCLGLFSTNLFVTELKTKEIGIRKVNGATISEVLILLNSSFVKWVAIAFVIACPIAYYAMHKWLENFAYKTTLSWWIFALAGVLALGIALLTVSWQSWRAATRNPVEALRYE